VYVTNSLVGWMTSLAERTGGWDVIWLIVGRMICDFYQSLYYVVYNCNKSGLSHRSLSNSGIGLVHIVYVILLP
jgi:hypothetical protein